MLTTVETEVRAKDVFLSARDVARTGRADYVAAQCGDDEGLRARVVALLAADDNAGRFLASPTHGAHSSVDGDAEFALLQRALAGRFSLDREIGRGGMGVVYLARDVALNRVVAIKLLPADMATRPEYRARFLKEVRTAAGMTHPNIVPIHLVEEQRDVVCFVMSYVEGETLREWVERAGPLSPHAAARIMQEVAWALAHAHERGIVHRDVKPDNILMERGSGRALVTDFGIAGTLEAGAAQTLDGVFLGTPLFASPEQASLRSIDGRSDIYSLGATMFFALTGRPVFESASAMAALEQHCNELPPRIGSLRADLPRTLTDAVDRCLLKDRDHRFESAGELAKTLTPAVSSSDEMPEPIRRVLRESMNVTADVGGLLIFAIVCLGGWWLDRLTANGFLADLSLFVLIIALCVGGAFLVIRILEALTESRDAMAAGYGAAQIRRAMSENSVPHGGRRGTRGAILIAGLALATVTCWIATYYSPIPTVPGVAGELVWIVAAFAPLLVGRLAIRQSLLNDTTGRGRIRRVSAWVGGLIVRVAAWRTPHRGAPDVVASPTETILVGSADSLLSQLPTAFRDNLSGVPALMRRLEKHADSLRSRREEIERALAEAGTSEQGVGAGGVDGSAGGLLRSHMKSARIGLADAHASAGARLADIIAALESVRLGLLRLRAGVAVPADLTSDLELAAQVGEQVEALLHGATEAENLT